MALDRLLAPLFLCWATCSQAQVSLGTFDDFQDGTAMDWSGADATNIPDGGPGGLGDMYMQLTSDPAGGRSVHLAGKNSEPRWTGHYLTAGVNGISVMMQNLGDTQLEMRVVVFNGQTNRFTSNVAFVLAPHQSWTAKTFSLAQSDLTRVQGSASYSTVMSAVTMVMFRHDAGSASAGGTAIKGSVGIDDIQAVPEPCSLVGCLLAVSASWFSRRRR